MPDTIIERIARYLCRVSYIDHESPDRNGPDIQNHVDEMWDAWTDEARELLSIIRDPTEGMETAGVLPAMSRDPARTWGTMIDAALAEGV